MESVAVITGANTGVGLAVAQRLLTEHCDIHICLACRNLRKAETARQSLLEEHPGAKVDVLQVDTSSPHSAIAAASEVQRRYQHVDWLYCNAGIMPAGGFNWDAFWPPTFSNLHHVFSTGGDFLQIIDGTTQEGLAQIFATNVFGHFLMIRHLEEFLSSQGRPCHIIWSSSGAGDKAHFDPTDIQGRSSRNPYATSKKLVDILSQELNRRLNDKGIYSDVAGPGMMVTQMTLAILGTWFWTLLYPLLILVRMFLVPTLTINPYNGSEAFVWLSRQPPPSLDHTKKYYSKVTALGKRYVDQRQLEDSEELGREVYTQLEHLAEQFST